jgi:hypothetical protein
MKVRCQRVSRAFASSLSLLSRTRSLVSLDFRFRGLCRDARTQTAERQATGLSPIPTVRSRAFSVVCRGREDDLNRVGVVLWGQETAVHFFGIFSLHWPDEDGMRRPLVGYAGVETHPHASARSASNRRQGEIGGGDRSPE